MCLEFLPRTVLLFASFAVGAPSLTAFAHAQTVPDAGSLRRQIEQAPPAPPPAAAPSPAPAPSAMQPSGGVRVPVRGFAIRGNTLLSEAQLLPALKAFSDQELDFAGLQQAADAVASAYREAGWLVRSYLPEQDVSSGVITIQVIEARFGGVRLEGEAPERVQASDVEAYFLARQRVGEFLSAADLDRGLLLSDDLPGVTTAGTLVPGANDGETALVWRALDEPRFYGQIAADNHGARSTGSSRVVAGLNFNSPGGHGELASLNLMHSEGSDYGRAALTVPVGHDGLRAGVSLSSLVYRVVEGPATQSEARVRGRSGSMGLDFSYPVLRARKQNLYVSGGLENKTFINRDAQLRSDYATNSLRLGLSGNRFDDWGGGGANSGSLQVTWGQFSDVQVHPARGALAHSYRKINYSLSRQQTLNTKHSLLLSWSGQSANQALDSSERFYIGGAQSVRAYPVSELGGDRANLLSVEWRWRVAPAWLLTAFVDSGRVSNHAINPGDTTASLKLHGRGVAVSWQGPKDLSAQVVWSRRNGQNPQPTATGSDSDGTLKRDRLWLTTRWSF